MIEVRRARVFIIQGNAESQLSESVTDFAYTHRYIYTQRTGVGHFSSMLGERGPVIKRQRCSRVAMLANSSVDAGVLLWTKIQSHSTNRDLLT